MIDFESAEHLPSEGRRPLQGVRVLELGGIGPVPHCGLLLADLGADVVRFERPDAWTILPPSRDMSLRGRQLISVNLKDARTYGAVMDVVRHADVLVEGFRPGVVERLGLAPDRCFQENPGLIYGRMTGWGQDGPLASAAGHDINYIAMNGVLGSMGDSGSPPSPPLNLVGDYGGGSMFLLAGILAALWQRGQTGSGQVVDASMIDGSSMLMQSVWSMRAEGQWNDERGSNSLDGSAPFYRCYACSDDKYVAVGALEPGFYSNLVTVLGFDEGSLPAQYDRKSWPVVAGKFETVFAMRSRDEWVAEFAGIDACLSPVLSLDEAAEHPHAVARKSFLKVEGKLQPAPTPRFSRSVRSHPSKAKAEITLDNLRRRWGVEM